MRLICIRACPGACVISINADPENIELDDDGKRSFPCFAGIGDKETFQLFPKWLNPGVPE